MLNTKLVVVIAPGKRPASIPNLEAKPGSANGTATARLWESRTPPQHTSSRRASSDWMRPFAFYVQRRFPVPARAHQGNRSAATLWDLCPKR